MPFTYFAAHFAALIERFMNNRNFSNFLYGRANAQIRGNLCRHLRKWHPGFIGCMMQENRFHAIFSFSLHNLFRFLNVFQQTKLNNLTKAILILPSNQKFALYALVFGNEQCQIHFSKRIQIGTIIHITLVLKLKGFFQNYKEKNETLIVLVANQDEK